MREQGGGSLRIAIERAAAMTRSLRNTVAEQLWAERITRQFTEQKRPARTTLTRT